MICKECGDKAPNLEPPKDDEIWEWKCSCFNKNNQPERSKREDVNCKEALRNNPFIRDIPECFINNDTVL